MGRYQSEIARRRRAAILELVAQRPGLGSTALYREWFRSPQRAAGRFDGMDIRQDLVKMQSDGLITQRHNVTGPCRPRGNGGWYLVKDTEQHPCP